MTSSKTSSRKDDKKVIQTFLKIYNDYTSYNYEIDSYPDEIIRNHKAVDALASYNDQKLAIEHTILLPFEGTKDDEPILYNLREAISSPRFKRPSWTIELILKKRLPKGFKISKKVFGQN